MIPNTQIEGERSAWHRPFVPTPGTDRSFLSRTNARSVRTAGQMSTQIGRKGSQESRHSAFPRQELATWSLTRSKVRALSTVARWYPASLGRRNRGRGDVASTTYAQGSGSLHEGCPGGQYIVHEQARDPAQAAPPSGAHLHRTLNVAGALPVVES